MRRISVDAAYLFAKSFIDTTYEKLSSDVVEATKKEILDLMGVAVGGLSEPGAKELVSIVRDWGGKEESSIIGCKQKVPAPNAAQANATMGHALDFDDVHEFAVIHPGIAVIPACMAIAEKKGHVTGKEFITSTALGVDMMCRLALATTPGTSPINTGWHLTTLYGFLGAAGTAGRLLGLDEEGIVNALGIAYHQCCGNGQCVKDGALTKRLGPGFAVRGGIMAALMAERGITGAKNSLEGEIGLYNLYMDGNYDPKVLTAELGQHFEGVNVAIKPYPCCRGIHPAIDAALLLSGEHGITPDSMEGIKVFVSDEHNFLLCTPQDAKCTPRNPVDAQFSIPWGVATAIVRNRAILEDFTNEAIKSPEILEITAKMEIESDPGLKRQDKVDPTRVMITTKEGDVYSRQVEDPLGSLQRPMTFDDCARKFRGCAQALTDEQMDRVIEGIQDLEKVNSMEEIIGLFVI